MFKKLEEKKVFIDPLYGSIFVEYELISQLIDTLVFSRLRRIGQLSGVKMVFYGAEHSRFNHSLGVYGLACKLLLENESLKTHLSEYEKIVFLCASLLHDIGHGPYSHAFERVFKINHEDLTNRFILENDEITKILNQAHPNLKTDILEVLSKNSKKEIKRLISSQLDIDRLDYLQRDAHYTGVNYGHLDLDRIFQKLYVQNEKIVYKKGALHAIENYLMSRYHMYWQVYYHPKARSHEVILEKIYQRIYDLVNDDKLQDETLLIFKRMVEKTYTLDDYYLLDDYYVNGVIKRYSDSKDKILKTLCNDFLNRNLFSYITVDNNIDEVLKKIIKKVNNNKYFFHVDQIEQSTYLKMRRDILSNDILILDKNKIYPIEKISPIIKSLIESGKKTETRIYYKVL